MVSSKFTARQKVSAFAIALAAVAGPVVAAPSGAVQLLGDGGASCDTSTKPGDNSLSCKPSQVAPTGAASETDLTQSNSSINYAPKPLPGG
jgi:hypothetical protein